MDLILIPLYANNLAPMHVFLMPRQMKIKGLLKMWKTKRTKMHYPKVRPEAALVGYLVSHRQLGLPQ